MVKSRRVYFVWARWILASFFSAFVAVPVGYAVAVLVAQLISFLLTFLWVSQSNHSYRPARRIAHWPQPLGSRASAARSCYSLDVGRYAGARYR